MPKTKLHPKNTPEPVGSTFGLRVREERQARGLSLTGLAERLGVTKGYLSRIEVGKAQPSPMMVSRLAAELDTAPGPLLVLAGHLPEDVRQILYDHPVDAPAFLRETFPTTGYTRPGPESDTATDASGMKTLDAGPAKAAGLYEIVRGDCLKWLEQRESCSIHAVVTDPPYGLKEYTETETAKLRAGRGGVWRIPPKFDGCQRSPLPRFTVLTEQDKEALRSFFQRWSRLVHRVLVPGGHVFVATNPLVSHLVYLPMIEAGFEKRGEAIRLVQTLRGGDRPKNAHNEFSQVTVMPRSAWEPWGLFRKPCEGRVQDNLRKWKTGGLRRLSPEQPFLDLIRSAPTRNGERAIAPHPSLKPQAFMRQIVRASLPLGEGVVLDPFMGAGSTIAAACAIGYRSIGIEMDGEYFKMAQQAIPRLTALRVAVDRESRAGMLLREGQPRLFD